MKLNFSPDVAIVAAIHETLHTNTKPKKPNKKYYKHCDGYPGIKKHRAKRKLKNKRAAQARKLNRS